MRYDDEAEEWLVLAEEQFKWLGPKGTSAGCTAQLQVALLPSSTVFMGPQLTRVLW